MIKVNFSEINSLVALEEIMLTAITPKGEIRGYRKSGAPFKKMASSAVYSRFKKLYRTTTFKTKAREAYVFSFMGEVMGVEMVRLLTDFTDEFTVKLSEEEKSNLTTPSVARNAVRLCKSELLKEKDVYFDGYYLFFRDSEDRKNLGVLDEKLEIESFHTIRLDRLDSSWVDFEDVNSFSSRDVLIYRPANGTEIYSPTFAMVKVAASGRAQKENPFRRKEGALLRGGAFVNLNFVKDAASLIGSLYGPNETKIFKVRKLMAEIGTVNLTKLPRSTLKLSPSGMTVMTAIAYMMRFIHMEDDLGRLRKLNKLFVNSFMTDGLTYESVISNIFPEGKEGLPPVIDPDKISINELMDRFRKEMALSFKDDDDDETPRARIVPVDEDFVLGG